MKELPHVFSLEDVPSDDELDALFSQLEQFEPPVDFVQRVMDAVSTLPLPQVPQVADIIRLDGEGLIVHQEHLQPS